MRHASNVCTRDDDRRRARKIAAPESRDRSDEYQHDKNAPPQPGDGSIGAWSREQLIAMDAAFVARLTRAVRSGAERAAAITATVITRSTSVGV